VKTELKRQKLMYANLAKWPKEDGLSDELESTIKAKLKPGAFAASFLVGRASGDGGRGERFGKFIK
jgi:hypothetical protein